MTALPEHYQQPYAAQAGQPIAGWPTQAVTGPVELYAEREPAVWVPSATDPNVMVCVPKQYVQPMQPAPPRDLTPGPLIDPLAARMLCGGVGAGAAGWGAGQVLIGAGHLFSALAGAGSALLAVALLLLAAKLPSAGRRGGDTYNITNKWWGKSTTNTKR